MIYTLTTNPAIDMNINSCGLVPGEVNRTFGAVYTPNGKGLNVSFVLGHFGVPSKVLGFFGGFSGRYIVEETRKLGYEVLPVWGDGVTRINVFLNDGKGEYKLVNEGAYVTDPMQEEMLRLLSEADDLSCLSISGSLPPGIPEEYYERVLAVCAGRCADVILDISSHALVGLLKYRPLLIKPNDGELESIFGLCADSDSAAAAAMKQLHGSGARNILLTMGEKGAYFYDGKHLYHAGAHPVKLLSSACAGDSALAAFLSIWHADRSRVEDALRLSMAVGANVAESNAIGALDRVEEYKEQITVRVVE